MKRYIVIAIACSLPLLMSAQKGKEYYDLAIDYQYGTGKVKRDFKKSRKYQMKAAKEGYAAAQYDMGVIYAKGLGVKKDYKEAVKWFQLATNQGHADAIIFLANMYSFGYGVPVDKQKAIELYESVAEKGNCEAIDAITAIYFESKQKEKQLEWYKRGADFGCAEAIYQLGLVYEGGYDVLQDFKKAEELYKKALEIAPKDGSPADFALRRVQEKIAKQANRELTVDLRQQDKGKSIAIARIGSDVDKDIPQARQAQEKTFALIIANENYEVVPSVPYASNDGATVEEYCRQALGIPGDNIRTLKDATYGQMKRGVAWLKDYMKAYQGKASVIIYYAGHGIPDEKDRTGYLLPTDGNAMNVSTAYALDDLYKELREDGAKSVVILLDACFSGMKREGSMLASVRGVAVKVKQGIPQGNTVVFSAAHGDETAYVYDEQKHGLFTYYLLKSLKEADSSLTLGELADYVTEKVMQQSVKMNSRMQTPTVIISPAIEKSWKSIAIK